MLLYWTLIQTFLRPTQAVCSSPPLWRDQLGKSQLSTNKSIFRMNSISHAHQSILIKWSRLNVCDFLQTVCQPEHLYSISSQCLIVYFDADSLLSRPKVTSCVFQGADLVRLSYCTASAHRVSDGLVRLESQLLADAGCETPAINYRRSNGRIYRCAFHIGCISFCMFQFFYQVFLCNLKWCGNQASRQISQGRYSDIKG